MEIHCVLHGGAHGRRSDVADHILTVGWWGKLAQQGNRWWGMKQRAHQKRHIFMVIEHHQRAALPQHKRDWKQLAGCGLLTCGTAAPSCPWPLPLLTRPVGLELEQLEGGKLDDDVHCQPRNHTWQAAGGGCWWWSDSEKQCHGKGCGIICKQGWSWEEAWWRGWMSPDGWWQVLIRLQGLVLGDCSAAPAWFRVIWAVPVLVASPHCVSP